MLDMSLERNAFPEFSRLSLLVRADAQFKIKDITEITEITEIDGKACPNHDVIIL